MDMLFPEDGTALLRLTDEEFVKRLPQGGGTLHAQLEVWKAACCDTTPCFDTQPSSAALTTTSSSTTGASHKNMPWSPADECPSAEASDDEDEEMPISPQPISTPPPSTSAIQTPPPKPNRQGGSHIHLWQLASLASPQQHGTAIRWLDRSKGVFKIKDSVRVARLWGRRKNRPAMNYDKLSRSIRQYYKKGIMQKTERSQRLVYQFCHPYCL